MSNPLISADMIVIPEFKKELAKYQHDLASPSLSADAAISNEVGECLLLITERHLKKPQFRYYSKDLKEDMRGHALQKCMRACQIVDLKRSDEEIFTYFCAAVYFSAITIIMKNYKCQNLKRRYMRHLLEKAGYAQAFIDTAVGPEIVSWGLRKNDRLNNLKKANKTQLQDE